MRRGRGALLASLAITVCSRTALADPSEQERTLANALFDEARVLMAAGQYAQACPKFAESMRLQPGGGTLLNLGVCHEHEGKIATAWGELKAALAIARRDGRADRETLALERLAVTEARLSYVTVRVSGEARLEGLDLRLDGASFAEPSWGSARPIDPGEHSLVVSAPGYERREIKLTIRADGGRASVDVPRLEPSRPGRVVPEHRSPLRGWHVAALVSGGIGLVGIGLGAGFGVSAESAWADAEAGCPRPDRCTTAGAEAATDAARRADLSTLGFVVGGAGLGLGAILFATGPSLVVEPVQGGAVVAVEARWP